MWSIHLRYWRGQLESVIVNDCVISAECISAGQSMERSFALLVRALEDLKPWEEKVAQIKTLRETLVQQQSATLEWLKGNGIRRWLSAATKQPLQCFPYSRQLNE